MKMSICFLCVFLFSFLDEDTTQLTIIRNINELNGNCIAILQDRRANSRLNEFIETEEEEENAEGEYRNSNQFISGIFPNWVNGPLNIKKKPVRALKNHFKW